MAWTDFDKYFSIFDLEGKKVIDSSYFISGATRKNLIVDSNGDSKVRSCFDFYSNLSKYLTPDLVLPEETVVELSDGLLTLVDICERKSNDIRNLANQTWSRYSNHTKTKLLSEISSGARDRRKLIKVVGDLNKKVFPSYLFENHAGEKERENLDQITDAFLEIGQQRKKSKRKTAREKHKFYVNKHIGNDEKIMAKSFALAYDDDVNILTSDSDLIHLFKLMNKHIGYYANKHRFEVPDRNIELVHLDRDWKFRSYDREGFSYFFEVA